MRSLLNRTRNVLSCLAICGGLALAPAVLATNVNPGQTLSPVPTAIQSGLTLETNGTVPFSIHFVRPFPNFGTFDTTGTVNYWVYRKADNTLVFVYSVTDAATSDTVINHWSVRDFFDFSTNVTAGVDLIAPFSDVADRAIRSADGNSFNFEYDLGFIDTCRPIYITTDAVSYDTRGRSTLWMFPTEGSATVNGIPRPVTDSTPPVTSITAPSSLGYTCNPATITGTASDSLGFEDYKVEYSASPNGPWTLIHASTTPVNNGTLATWNTTSVAQNWYYIRVTATNTAGLVSVVSTLVWVDKQFDTVDLRSPGANQLLGGGVCFDGTVNDGQGGSFVNYTISYAPLPAGAPFLPVNPATPTYTTAVINDGLGSWQTASGPAAVTDGNYRLRIVGTDQCGNTKTVTRDVTIDNTAPIGVITSPVSCGYANGLVTVTGTASDAHMAGWALQYTGGSVHTWVTIASGNTNVSNGTLGVWNTNGLPPCSYTLRLIVGDGAAVNCSGNNNQAEYFVSVDVGCPADFNRSGIVSVQDVFDFLARFFGTCP